MSNNAPRIIRTRIEHREAVPERPNPAPAFRHLMLRAIPAHDVLVVEVCNYGRNRGTEFGAKEVRTLEFPADISASELQKRLQDGSDRDMADWRAGD